MSSPLEYLQGHENAFKSPNRLASLYSSFHTQRVNNPDGYAANAAAWSSGLTKLARAGLLPSPETGATTSSLAFTSGPALSRALATPQYGQPLALGAVLNESIHKGDLIPLKSFLASEKSIYHKPWISLPSPVQVVTWGLSAIGLTATPGTSDKLVQGSFVVRANVEAAAASVVGSLASRSSLTDRIIPRDEFEKEFASALDYEDASKLSSVDFGILLRYLSRDRPVLSYTASTVKVAPSGQQPPEAVTAQDESIANLRGLIASITTQVDRLQAQITTSDRDARLAVAEKQNARAKQALRQKRAAETLLDQRSKTLESLESTWRAIEAAADNIAIVRAMRESSVVLKGLNAAVGGAEGVDAVMEGLRVQVDTAEDINTIVAEQSGVSAVDETEVEDELAALEKGEREKEEAKERQGRAAQAAVEQAERAQREGEEAEKTRRRLEGVDVPAAAPAKKQEAPALAPAARESA